MIAHRIEALVKICRHGLAVAWILLIPSMPVGAAPVGTEGYQTIDVPGATDTGAFGTNDLGDIVGRWDDADFNTHGFLLHKGVYTTIDFPGATFTAPRTINNRGDIVGRYVD